MGSAAKLYGISLRAIIQWITERKNANFIAIFFAKERNGASFNRIVRVHEFCLSRFILLNDLIHLIFDLCELLARNRCAVANVKTDTFTVNHLTLLRDMITQNAAQGFMEQMRRRMITFRFLAVVGIDREMRRIADFYRAREGADMGV